MERREKREETRERRERERQCALLPTKKGASREGTARGPASDKFSGEER